MAETYPRTIDNGAGEEMTFLRVVRGPEGERLEVEGRAKPGAGPPMHVHHLQEESVTVVAGKLGYQTVGGPPHYAGPGETAFFSPGTGHRWWNAGDTELRCTGHVSPPGNFEYYLTSVFESMKRGGQNRPGVFDAAYLAARYRSEFAMVEIPPFVQKVVFPVIVALGSVLGKYGRFIGAPEPITGEFGGLP